jgi:RHS repeat-associated protein
MNPAMTTPLNARLKKPLLLACLFLLSLCCKGIAQINPDPDNVYPEDVYCEKCEGGEKIVEKSDTSSCPAGTSEVADADSVNFQFGVGTSRYISTNKHISRDYALCMPPYKNYNPARVGHMPLMHGLSRELKYGLVRPVVLGLLSENITAETANPSAIELYGGTGGTAWVGKDSLGNPRQVLTHEFLTDIRANVGGGTIIRIYPRSQVSGGGGSGGPYYLMAPDTPPAPVVSEGAEVLYPLPVDAEILRQIVITYNIATSALDIVTKDFTTSKTLPKIRGYRWVQTGGTTTLSYHAGSETFDSAKVFAKTTLVKDAPIGGLVKQRRTRMKSANAQGVGEPFVVASVVDDYIRDLGGGMLRVFKRVEDPDSTDSLTTEYTYTVPGGDAKSGSDGQIYPLTPPPPGSPPYVYTPGTPNTYTGGRLLSIQRSDGLWKTFSYNLGFNTMITEIRSSWKDEAFGSEDARLTTVTVTNDSMSIIEKIAGKVVSNFSETSTTGDGTCLQSTTQTGGASPLVTETAYYSDVAESPKTGRISYIRHSDGTLTRYTYSIATAADDGIDGIKTVVENGAIGETLPAVGASGPVTGAFTAGTRTETIKNAFDRVISTKVTDIASNRVLSKSIASTVDTVGRPTTVIHNEEPTDYETFEYSCCGLAKHRARDGTVTEYTRDPLGRTLSEKVTVGTKITTTATAYSSETIGGRVLPKTTVTRSITAGSSSTASLLVSESINNLRGQTLVSRSPDTTGDGVDETTTYTYSPTTRTSTYTNARGTTTSTYYKDGQLASSVTKSGTISITPLTSYDYTTHDLNGGGIKTKVTTSGAGIRYSYSDLARRTFRTESPGYSGATLVSTTTFDDHGRATGQSSTGKPATLRVLNALGETTEVWTNSNGDTDTNGAPIFNDTPVNDIQDSVVKTQSDYVVEDSYICRRTRQWIRNDGGTDIPLSTTYSSVDGTYQKTVPLAGTGPITVTTATKPSNGNSSSETHTYLGSDLTSPSLLSSVSTTLDADGTTTTTQTNKGTAGADITTTSQTADLQGRTTKVVGERGLTTTYSDFTASGQPLGVTSQGTYTKTTLDAQGRVTQTVTRENDSAGDIIATVNTSYSYEADGTLVIVRSGTNTYPTLTKQNILGRTVELHTFRQSDLAFVPAPNATDGDKTIWDYEPATGLLLSKRDHEGKGATYTYTSDGKVLTRTWARGRLTTYGYTNGRLTAINYTGTDATWQTYVTKRNAYNTVMAASGSTDAEKDAALAAMNTAYSTFAGAADTATPNVSITYNRLGQRTSISSLLSSVLQSSVSYSYDTATLALDKEKITYPGGFTRILDHTAPSLGRPKGWDLGTPGSTLDSNGVPNVGVIENTAAYDYSTATGRLETVSGNSSGTFTYGYGNNSSLIETVIRPGLDDDQPALRVTNTPDSGRNVLLTKANALVSGESDTDGSSITYTVNSLGQRTNASRTRNGAASNGTEWGYDDLGQVTSANDTNDTADRGYLYDAIGNRRATRVGVGVPLNQNGTIKGDEGTVLYAANPLNQYTATPHATAAPVHDFDGNLTEDRGGNKNSQDRQYVWDAENRLIAVNRVLTRTTGGAIDTTSPLVSYIYDAQSRRIATTVADASSGGVIGTTLCLYDGWNCIAEYQLQNSSFNLHTSYLWGLDLSGGFQGAGGVGGLLSVNTVGGSVHYPTYDGNGNITEYLTAAGDVAAHFEYDPFGNLTAGSSANAASFPYRFSTKPQDAVTGLYYYGYRWYDPLTGRWPSRDPIGERGGVNLYGFIYNSPSATVDVEGMRPLDGGDARRAADSGCRIALAYYNRNNFYRMPTGMPTSGGVANVAGAQIAGLGYYLAVKEAGANAQNRAKTLMDAYVELMESACRESFPSPPAPPTPSPSDSGLYDYADCEYSCDFWHKGTSLGNKACLYGDCKLVSQTGGNLSCPSGLPGAITVILSSGVKCPTCDGTLKESRTYRGKPFKPQTDWNFIYVDW